MFDRLQLLIHSHGLQISTKMLTLYTIHPIPNIYLATSGLGWEHPFAMDIVEFHIALTTSTTGLETAITSAKCGDSCKVSFES